MQLMLVYASQAVRALVSRWQVNTRTNWGHAASTMLQQPKLSSQLATYLNTCSVARGTA